MVGEGRRIAWLSRGLPLVVSGLVAAALLATPAFASTLTANTNRGGTCRLHTSASRSGEVIKYGIGVNDCSTRFGVRYIVSEGGLYDQTAGIRVKDADLARKKSHLPYSNRRSVSGTDTTHAYKTVIEVSIVLKTRRDRSTRHPEHWIDPGKRCRVTTTWRDGDTLGCTLSDNLAAG
jgi:hypothetical protein